MLKYRLFFGTLMVVAFIGACLVDGWLDGSLSASTTQPLLPVSGTILCILIVLFAIPAQLELANLIERTGPKIFRTLTIPASMVLVLGWYIRQFFSNPFQFQLYHIIATTAAILLMLFVLQAVKFANTGTIANCSANLFACFYLGFLSGFVLGIRVDLGLWPLLMFVFTVKSSDIGAYTIGKLFGKHKLSPKISPSKTWEGLAGAILFAVIVSVVFAVKTGKMSTVMAVLFGGLFAVLGQLGDLAESMIKRDAQQKDSASSVPGFGGILDIIDSPIATAPAAYLFLMLTIS
ncbi:MAG: phosphatidate cytidylyltransferase [Sedimentisphaerales bacterium]|nr:phosphatidate cytidylyltransferase [Sedimentisphaerales bacterium]